MSAARTILDASSASFREVKIFPFCERNSTILRRLLCQLLQMDSMGSGRKSPSLRYQYSFSMEAKIQTYSVARRITLNINDDYSEIDFEEMGSFGRE